MQCTSYAFQKGRWRCCEMQLCPLAPVTVPLEYQAVKEVKK